MKNIIFVVTQACNLNCDYCFELHSQNMITFNIMREFFLENLNSENDYYIDFFGGEPLLNFSVIKQFYEWAHPMYHIHYHLTTNGLLLKDEIYDWLLTKTDVFITLSIDGAPTSDVHRHTHFSEKDLIYWNKLPNLNYSMVVMPDTIKDLTNNILFLSKYNTNIRVNLAKFVEFSVNDYQNYLIELKKLYMLQDESLAPLCSLFDSERLLWLYNTPISDCTDRDTIVCDYNGLSYKCIYLLPMSRQSNIIAVTHYDDCAQCPLHVLCFGCKYANQLESGDLTKPDIRLCRFRLAEIYFLTKFIINHKYSPYLKNIAIKIYNQIPHKEEYDVLYLSTT